MTGVCHMVRLTDEHISPDTEPSLGTGAVLPAYVGQRLKLAPCDRSICLCAGVATDPPSPFCNASKKLQEIALSGGFVKRLVHEKRLHLPCFVMPGLSTFPPTIEIIEMTQ